MTIEDRKHLIHRMLTPDTGAGTDAASFANRSLWLWERIASQLTPLIGEVGFQSLYARAVHLALSECPGFTIGRRQGSTSGLFQILKRDLIGMEYEIASRCNAILLQKFTDLVESMIGPALLGQILYSAWDDQQSQANG